MFQRDHQGTVEHGDSQDAEDRGRRHEHLRLLRYSAQGAYAHATHASESEQHVVAKVLGDMVVQRHAGEGGEGEEGAHGKAGLVVVEFLPQLGVVRDL